MRLLKTTTLSATLLSAALASSTTLAQQTNNLYGGVQIIATHTSYSSNHLIKSVDLPILVGKLGYQFNQNFAMEARLGFGIDSATKNDFRSQGYYIDKFDGKVDNLLGLYGVAKTDEIGHNLKFFGLLGLTRVSVSSSTTILYGRSYTISRSETDTSLSFGGGIEYSLSPKAAITLEYASYMRGSTNGSDYDTTGFAIGLQSQF